MLRSRIDWCDSSFNPVTGCYHECPYCYARGISTRFKSRGELIEPETHHLTGKDGREIIECNEQPYIVNDGAMKKIAYPYGFIPTFHRYRLNEYKDKKGRNIFVGSMADLWGEWVPGRWLAEILRACENAPQHNYLFLTKNPARYEELNRYGELPTSENFWYGTTVTKPSDKFAFGWPYKNFVSIEPIHEDFGKAQGALLTNWVIIGAETGNRKDKVIPKREWVQNIVDQCKERNIPVFMKSNLVDVWGDDLIQEFPKQLEKLPNNR